MKNIIYDIKDFEALKKQIFNEKDDDSRNRLINDLTVKIDKIDV